MICTRFSFRILVVLVVLVNYQHFLFGQSPVHLSVSFNNNTVDELIQYLEQEQNIRIYSTGEDNMGTRRVTGNVSTQTVKTILETLLGPIGIQVIEFNQYLYILTTFTTASGNDLSNYFVVKEKLSRESKPNALTLGHPDSMSRSGMAILQGKIQDGADETPVAGALIRVDTLMKFSDSLGYFEINVPIGWHTIWIESNDYLPVQQEIKVYGQGSLLWSIYKNSIELPELVIAADAGRRIENAQAGVAELSLKEIKRLPALFGEADVLKSLLTLPGVSNTGEVGGGYHVRGGNIDQNLIQQDGVAYLNPTHVLGLFSAFNADAIKAVTLYKGHIPAQFGGRASSVLDIKLKDPDLEKWSVHGGVGPISSKLFVEGPLIKDKTSFMAGNRMTYSSWVLKLVRDPNLKESRANFYDLNAKLYHRFRPGSSLSVSAYSSKDDFKYARDFGYGWQTQSVVSTWMHEIKPNLLLQSSIMWNTNKNEFIDQDDKIKYQIENGLAYYKGKFNLSWQPSPSHSFQFGMEGIQYLPENEVYEVIHEESSTTREVYPKTKGQEGAIYIQEEVRVTRMLNLSIGYRHSFFRHTGSELLTLYEEQKPRIPGNIVEAKPFGKGKTIKAFQNPEPRVSLAYKLSENSSIKWSYNRVNQYIHLVSNTAAATPVDIWQLSNYHLSPQRSDNFSIGYFKNFNNNQWETSFELYYKKSKDLLEYKDFARLLKNDHLETELFAVQGKSYGAEVFVKRIQNNPTGYISYTLNKSLRRSPGLFPDEVINKGKWYASNFDKPHNLNAVMDWQVRKTMSWSFNFVYNSGRPATAPVADFYLGEGGVFLDYSDRNAHRIPDYHRLDISFTVTRGAIRSSKNKGSVTFSVYNVYSRRNAFSIFYRRNNNEPLVAYKLSVLGTALPSITYNFQF